MGCHMWEVVSIVVTVVATVAIAYYSRHSYKLSQKLNEINVQHQQEIKDLFQAIVVSNLVDKGSATTTAIREFKQNYKGDIKIFDD